MKLGRFRSFGFILALGLVSWGSGLSYAQEGAEPATEERVVVEKSSPYAVEMSNFWPFEARIGLGGTIDPGTFLLIGSFEFHIDRFFTLGPMLQLGFGSDVNLYAPTLNGRFEVPIYPWKRVEFSVQSGMGFVVRQVADLTFTSFLYNAGIGFDYFILDQLTAGIGGLVNVTSNNAERVFGSLYAMAVYRF